VTWRSVLHLVAAAAPRAHEVQAEDEVGDTLIADVSIYFCDHRAQARLDEVKRFPPEGDPDDDDAPEPAA
jgi:hypothetical protein